MGGGVKDDNSCLGSLPKLVKSNNLEILLIFLIYEMYLSLFYFFKALNFKAVLFIGILHFNMLINLFKLTSIHTVNL